MLNNKKVSIHTPTKGVTKEHGEWWLPDAVSIHTPTKGVTHYQQTSGQKINVSIHTPTKGVTGIGYHHVVDLDGFNPHTHEGCDAQCGEVLKLEDSFNPHTHEGCDFNNL